MNPTNNENIARLANELISTIKKKNHDYGNAFAKRYAEHGDVVGSIHISEKADRIASLIHVNAEVDESIDDALMDCAGYCLLTLDQRLQRKNKEEKKF